MSFTVLTLNFSIWTFDVNFIGLDVKQIKLLCHIWKIIFTKLIVINVWKRLMWYVDNSLAVVVHSSLDVVFSWWIIFLWWCITPSLVMHELFPAIHESLFAMHGSFNLLCMDPSLAMHNSFLSRCMTPSLAMHDSLSCDMIISLAMHDYLFWNAWIYFLQSMIYIFTQCMNLLWFMDLFPRNAWLLSHDATFYRNAWILLVIYEPLSS